MQQLRSDDRRAGVGLDLQHEASHTRGSRSSETYSIHIQRRADAGYHLPRTYLAYGTCAGKVNDALPSHQAIGMYALEDFYKIAIIQHLIMATSSNNYHKAAALA